MKGILKLYLGIEPMKGILKLYLGIEPIKGKILKLYL